MQQGLGLPERQGMNDKAGPSDRPPVVIRSQGTVTTMQSSNSQGFALPISKSSGPAWTVAACQRGEWWPPEDTATSESLEPVSHTLFRNCADAAEDFKTGGFPG